MIKGPLTVIVLGPAGSGKSQLVELLCGAIIARNEKDMASHVLLPSVRVVDGDVVVGHPDSTIRIHTIQCDVSDMENLKSLWDEIRKAAAK